MSTKLVKKSGVLDFINQPFTEEKFLSLKKEYDLKTTFITLCCSSCNTIFTLKLEALLTRHNRKRFNTLCSHCSSRKYTVETCLKRYGVPSTSQVDEFKMKAKQTSLERYGVESYSQTQECKDKTRETFKAKYGEYWGGHTPEQQEKYKQTMRERYGVESYSQTNEFKQNQSNIAKNRTPEEKQQIRDKIKSTCISRYGVDNFSKTDSFKEKFTSTMQERYGINYTGESEELRNKMKKTMIERYGVENTFQIKEFHDKAAQLSITKEALLKKEKTCLERYGETTNLKTDDFKEKSQKTCLEKYGVSFIGQSDLQKEKSKQTCLRKYGVKSFSQSEEANHCRKFKYSFNNEYFDSSWELAFYIFHYEQNIEIIHNPKPIMYLDSAGKQHYYKPDFKIKDQIYEIKGDQFLKENTLINPYSKDRDLNDIAHCKFDCMMKNNVIIISSEKIKPYLDFMKTKYGSNWKHQFKV